MPMLNIFDNDSFTLVSLTGALNTVPVVPGMIGELGLFTEVPIRTTIASFEEKGGTIRLIPMQERGAANRVLATPRRKMRNFNVPHYPLEFAVLADDVMGVRAFGTESEQVTIDSIINEKLTIARQSHELTEEYSRVGAIQGVVYDADGTSVIYDFFSEFGITEQTVSFNFGTGVNPKTAALEVLTKIGTALGGITYTYVLGLCGATFYSNLVNSDVVNENMTNINERFPIDQQREGIVYGDIVWRPYRGNIGGTPLIPDDECRFVPVGVPRLFQEVVAPADIMAAVGTLGQRYYAIPERMKFDKGVEVHTQHNILPLCTRPLALVKGTDDTV